MPRTTVTPSEKTETAKRLLVEATLELQRDRQQQRAIERHTSDAHRCECGHRRNHHTVSTSINYTEGFCMTEGCNCRWFIMREER